eukprot:XP_011441665.1 PREDICTED: uncharacterized protein LOC105338306 [Crassostrea gigas]
MGLFFSSLKDLFETFSSGSPARIVMLGLDAAGKTTILYKIKLNEIVSTIPTIGFNVETVSPVKGVTFTVWDIGGQDKIRPLWKHYFNNTEGLVYVVDSNDRERILESREELFGILNSDEMRGVPVVVIANKQDLPNALSTSKVADLMSLHKLTSRKWYIQAACATTGEGIFEAMKELSSMVKEYKKGMRYKFMEITFDQRRQRTTIFRTMGLLLTRLLTAFESFSQESSVSKILMLGLDSAGKTTILYKIKLNENVQGIPTVGFNVETVSPIKGVSFTVWDVGGQEVLRPLWKHYYQNTHGLVYVVDSNDRERILMSREELFGILENDEMRGVPVVIIANKQDQPNALSTSDVADLLCLHKLTSRKWFIQPACAIKGEGLHESISELATLVKDFKKVSR